MGKGETLQLDTGHKEQGEKRGDPKEKKAETREKKPDDREKRPEQKEKKEWRFRWAVQVFFISVALSALLSFCSNEALEGAELALAFGVLAFFILLGILFDIIGVAVTAADESPFHSMAARKTPGARQALALIRRANKVSSFCNDVVGDICGIVSGSTAAVIVLRVQEVLPVRTPLTTVGVSLAITALVSGLTIGGKAVGKTFAIEKSTAVLQLVGRVMHVFSSHRKR